MASVVRPTLFVASLGDPRSQLVLRELMAWLMEPAYKALLEEHGTPSFWFGGPFEGVPGDSTVALFDAGRYLRGFRFHDFSEANSLRPDWALGIRWGVEIGERSVKSRLVSSQGPHSVTHQVAGVFVKNFTQPAAGCHPWGPKGK